MQIELFSIIASVVRLLSFPWLVSAPYIVHVSMSMCFNVLKNVLNLDMSELMCVCTLQTDIRLKCQASECKLKMLKQSSFGILAMPGLGAQLLLADTNALHTHASLVHIDECVMS